mmetsp:Transcript_6777/g.14822  ORF Transcript_6777/g.14822 Transcript_6777/m.14822 type:complete len:202 (-) Transcript_6777:263-868(-)
MYLALTRSPMTRSTRCAFFFEFDFEGALDVGARSSSPSPSSPSDSSSVATRSSSLSSTASASSTKRFGSTEKRSRPVRPATFLPCCSCCFALPSLLLSAAAFASFFAFSHASRRSSVTGVRVLTRARCHSIFSTSSVGSGSSTTTTSFFSSFTSFFFGFFTASWNRRESSAARAASFCIDALSFCGAALAAAPPCACFIIC